MIALAYPPILTFRATAFDFLGQIWDKDYGRLETLLDATA